MLGGKGQTQKGEHHVIPGTIEIPREKVPSGPSRSRGLGKAADGVG